MCSTGEIVCVTHVYFQDISLNNVLVNHFSTHYSLAYNQTRAKLRVNGRLSYGLIDFDYSYKIPPGANRNEYRLPYDRSWGSWNWTEDAGAGEFDYDPFVLDVGTMGVGLCLQYQVGLSPSTTR